MPTRRCHLSALLSLAAIQSGAAQSTSIQWSADGTPHIMGADAERGSEEDSWEDAWWGDGFAEDGPEQWFAASREPRGARPVSMQDLNHRVGTVYTHTMSGATGVIIGWDPRTRAPKEWLGPNLPGHRSWSERLRRLYAPHYSVLEEIDDGKGNVRLMQRYIVAHCTEEGETGPPCLRIERSRRSRHPDVDKYFSGYDVDAGVYLPNDELARLYPHG